MNPIQDLINNLQNLMTQVPELIRPLIAGIAAATGNLIAVLIVVLVCSRARVAVVSCRADRREPVVAGDFATGALSPVGRGTSRPRAWNQPQPI